MVAVRDELRRGNLLEAYNKIPGAPNRNNDEHGNRNDNLGLRLLSKRSRQRVRFKDRARVPTPCPSGSSRSGEEWDEQQQPAASGRPEARRLPQATRQA